MPVVQLGPDRSTRGAGLPRPLFGTQTSRSMRNPDIVHRCEIKGSPTQKDPSWYRDLVPADRSDALRRAVFAPAADGLTIQVIDDRIHSQMMPAGGKRDAARPADELIGIVHFDLG
jgi:hypothetical protein